MRRVALLTLLAFGCATVRQPVAPAWLGTSTGEASPLTTHIEPDLELWMEGTGPIDASEAAYARDASQEALSRAIADHGLDAAAAAGDDLVLVRARGVVRTAERKNAQLWSIIGIVVTVVVVVVAVIFSTKGHSGPKAPSHAAVPAYPRVPPAHPRVAPLPARPGPYAPAFVAPPPPPVPFQLDVQLWTEIPLYDASPPPAVEPPPWATPTDEWIAARGWFDGEELELMVTLVDRASGSVRWANTVRKHVDPRDAEGVSRLLGQALADGPLSQKTP